MSNTSNLMHFIYFITAKNIEVIQKCNSSIKNKIITQFISHLVAFIFVVAVGGAGINSFLDNPTASYFAAVIIAIVAFLCDRAVIESSVVSPEDGLGGKRNIFRSSFLLRLVLSVIVACAVSIPIELHLQNSYLQKLNKENYKNDNAELFERAEKYRQQKILQNDKKIQSLDESLSYHQMQLNKLVEDKNINSDRIRNLRNEISKAKYERGQEASGQDGRKDGEGKLFNFWSQNVVALQTELGVYEAENSKIESDIVRNERTVRQLHREKKELLNYSPEVDVALFVRNLQKQPEYQGLEDGLLIRLMLLKQLHNHPDYGSFTTAISILLLVFFALIEMSPLVVHKLSRIGEYERQLFLFEKSQGVRLVKEHEAEIAGYRNSTIGANVVPIEAATVQQKEASL